MRNANYKKGFTLIELLVVIAIIALLSSVVLSNVTTARTKARNARRFNDLHTFATVLALYANDHNGSYPSTGGDWYGVHSCWPNGVADWIPGLVSGGYLPKLPRDPSDSGSSVDSLCEQQQYIYTSDGTDYKLLVHNNPVSGDMTTCGSVISKYPIYTDPVRNCWAFGIYTPGAAGW